MSADRRHEPLDILPVYPRQTARAAPSQTPMDRQ